MSRSSSLVPVDAVATSGSSAIPQTGQLPGPLRRISGCIGHVHTPSEISFSAAVRLFYLIRADFMVVVVMVMFTGIFGKIMIGMGFKFALTAGGAEIKLMVLVSNAAVRLVRQDDHPAHGISHLMQCVTLVRG